MSTPPSPPPGPGHSWPPPASQSVWAPPPGYGQSPSPSQPELNGFALASLLVGLLCLPPLGIVFGVVALVQIAKKRQRGKALAIVGLVVSVVMTGVLAVTVDRVGAAVRDRIDAMGELGDVEGDLTDLDDLRVGDCFNVPHGDLMAERPLTYKVDCAQAHHGEVTASKAADLGTLPESAEADRASEDACWKAQDEYAMDTWALPAYADMFYFAPSRQSWRQGDRRLLCVIGTTEEEQRGSLRRDGAMLKPEQSAFLRAANAVEFLVGRPPEDETEDALPEHQAWAREVYAALGEEAKALEADKGRPGLGKAVQAQLAEIETARAAWHRTSQARTAADFDKLWGRAVGAMSLETEKALRGAYGLSTEVPEWLEESSGSPGGGAGRGPSAQAA